MKFNGDILVLCPKNRLKNALLSEGGTIAKLQDKTGITYTFKLMDDVWAIDSVKRVDAKRRLKNGRKQRISKRSI